MPRKWQHLMLRSKSSSSAMEAERQGDNGEIDAMGLADCMQGHYIFNSNIEGYSPGAPTARIVGVNENCNDTSGTQSNILRLLCQWSAPLLEHHSLYPELATPSRTTSKVIADHELPSTDKWNPHNSSHEFDERNMCCTCMLAEGLDCLFCQIFTGPPGTGKTTQRLLRCHVSELGGVASSLRC